MNGTADWKAPQVKETSYKKRLENIRKLNEGDTEALHGAIDGLMLEIIKDNVDSDLSFTLRALLSDCWYA